MYFSIRLNKPAFLQVCTGLFLMQCSGFSSAITELDISAYSNTEYTSNARRVTTDTKNDVIERLGLEVRLSEERKRFDANANFRLEQEYYLNDTFSEQTNLTTGFGLFNFDIVEDFLDWRTSFTRTQTLSDPAEANTPDNREERNVLRTGPAISYRINPNSLFRFSTNFVQVENSDDTTADTKRIDGKASYSYQFNSITQFSLNGNYDEIIESDVDDPLQPDVDDEIRNISLYLGMNRQFHRGNLSINAGQNQVRSDTRETVSGNFFNVALERDQVLSHHLFLNYSESISDSSIGFTTLEDLLVTNPDPNAPTDLENASSLDIIKRKRFDVGITRDIETFQYSVNAFWTDLNYEIQASDERSSGLTVSGRQRMQESWTAGVSYQQMRQNFIDRPLDGKSTTHTYRVETDYRWTQNFSTNGFIAYEQRQNDDNFLREYEEFSVGLGLKIILY